ncbi:TPA: 50S ribosomal protein L30 [Candidatus Micrarchaeota archaeon]|nr:50S ribosomal protein L30 [Candidatus Micrarchaeota archaeon]HIH29816.1 50S ribosomal protein L30 [Candidatus Micrarchaeota archaeon]
MKIAVIRLKGKFSVSPSVKNTLIDLKLDRLYACTLLPEGATAKGMIQACKDVVSFGEANKESIALLLSKRGRAIDGKKLTDVKKPEEIEKIASEAESSPKKLEELGVSPVFFLSPPRGGFGKRKAHVPFGPVGKNPNINELISSMA